MTALPPPSKKKLGLVIDLDTCVGCHACATSCKEWNAGGIAGPLTDERPYAKDPQGVWFNRVHSYELAEERPLPNPPPQAGEGAKSLRASPRRKPERAVKDRRRGRRRDGDGHGSSEWQGIAAVVGQTA